MIVVYDKIKTIIDSIRDTGAVSVLTDNHNGTYTITTTNTDNLQIGFKIVLKYADTSLNRDVIISSFTETSITFASSAIIIPDSWELAIYFEQGSHIELNKKYENKAKSINKLVQEYPLIWLYSGYDKNPSNFENVEFETPIQGAIVNFSEMNLYESDRIEDKFKPVLYPYMELLDNAFNTLPNKANFVTAYGIDKEIRFSIYDRPFFGSFNKKKNVMPQITDAIEFEALLRWKKFEC